MYIILSKGVNPNKMIAKLYHDTPLESHFTINMWVLKDGRYPTLMGLKEIFQNYINHIRICKKNILQFDLDKAAARLNVVEGLLIAVANIDEVIAIIRASNNPSDAAAALIARFGFNKPQVDAILAMKLSSLTKLDGLKLNDEKEELARIIDELTYIINTPTALDEELIKILNEVASKFGDARRTKIENILGDEEEPEVIEEKDIAILQYGNTLKVAELPLKKQAKPGNVIYTTNLGGLTCITSAGKMYNAAASKLKVSKEYKINEVFEIGGEHPRLLIDTLSFNAYKSLTCITRNGFIKKSSISEYTVRSKKGASVLKLEEGDSVVAVILSSDDDDKIAIIGNNDYYNCYRLSEISCTGRVTKGVKAIKLEKDGYVKDAKWVGDDTYKITGRAVKGVKNG
jgi:DNA gyrase subunit A